MNSKKIFGSTLLIALAFILFAAPFAVNAQYTGPSGSGSTDSSASSGGGATGTSLKTMIDNLKAVLVGFTGSLAVIGWLIAGILYLTSVGNPGKMETAKKAAIAATIGTLIVALALLSGNAFTDIINSAFKLS